MMSELAADESAALLIVSLRYLPEVDERLWPQWRRNFARLSVHAGIPEHEIPAEFDPAFLADARQQLAPLVGQFGGYEALAQMCDPPPTLTQRVTRGLARIFRR